MEELSFQDKMKNRTKALAVRVLKMYGQLPKCDEIYIIGKQLIRSSTSVAANFRAFTRGRSEKEKFSKLCIVVEEADETLFWIEILEEAELVKKERLSEIKTEITEILSILASFRRKMKSQNKQSSQAQ